MTDHCLYRLFLLTALALPTAAWPPPACAQEFAADSTDGALWNRPEAVNLQMFSGVVVPYREFPFYVTQPGDYTIEAAPLLAEFDAVLFLYDGFDPAFPLQGLYAGADQTVAGASETISFVLMVGRTYYAVTTGSQASDAGPFTLTFSGPALVLAAADFNGDGLVNGDDLVPWQENFGALDANAAQGDADGDLDVDGADFLRWQQAVAPVAPPELLPAPEPAAAILGFMALGGVAWSRRRRPPPRRCLLPLVAAVLAAASGELPGATTAMAEALLWTGQGATSRWSNSDNWSLGVPANDGSSDLLFGATANAYLTVADIPGSTGYGVLAGSKVGGGEINGMTFLSAAGAYDVRSTPIPGDYIDGVVLRSGGITNLSSQVQTFNTRVYLDDRFSTTINAANGGLRFNYTVTSLGGGNGTQTFGGNSSISFGRLVTLSPAQITKMGPGALTFEEGFLGTGSAISVNGGAIHLTANVPQFAGNELSLARSLAINGNSTVSLSGGAKFGVKDPGSMVAVNAGAINAAGVGTSLAATRDLYSSQPANPLVPTTVGVTGSGKIGLSAQSSGRFDVLTLGASHQGELILQSGAAVTGQSATLGLNPGASGFVLATDPGTSWAVDSDVTVGHAGSGGVEIRSGGRLSSARGHLGLLPVSAGSVFVSDPGSVWNAAGSLFIGNGGLGSLQVVNGGGVSTAGNSYLGFSPGADGRAVVSGAGATWNTAATLAIGGSLAAPGGTGSLRIENGGAVHAAATILYATGALELVGPTTYAGPVTSLGGIVRTIGDTGLANDLTLGPGGVNVINSSANSNATFSGRITGSGGLTKSGLAGNARLTLTGQNDYAGPTTVNSGVLVVDGSVTSTVTVSSNATLGGAGTTGPIEIRSGGTISPGASPGLLTTGDAVLRGGANYRLELRSDGGGAAGADWDAVAVNGLLDLSSLSAANPLRLRLRTLDAANAANPLSGWNPGTDHTWSSIFTAAGIVGDVDSSLFQIDPAEFQNPLQGDFRVVRDGNSLHLHYDAVEVDSAVLVSNLSQPFRGATPLGNNPNPADPPEGPGLPWFWGAQSFRTDGQSRTLTSVEAMVGDASDNPPPIIHAALYADDGGVLGELITTFIAPDAAGPPTARTFTPAAEVVLEADANYWFMLGSAAPGDGTFSWQYANTGQSLGPGTLGAFADSTDSGATWTYRGASFPYYLQVNAAPLPPPPADFDGDGRVDGEDLAALLANFGAVDAWRMQGDADGNGDIDGADFLLWQRQRNAFPALSVVRAQSVALPESTGVIMMALATVSVVAQGRTFGIGRSSSTG